MPSCMKGSWANHGKRSVKREWVMSGVLKGGWASNEEVRVKGERVRMKGGPWPS